MKTPERWQEVKEILYPALEMAPGERPSFLDEKCVGDNELRREIESLIAAHGKAAERFDSPAVEKMAAVVSNGQADDIVGTAIGHYTIIAKLGAGGMGEVYLAQDSRLNRKVALKLLPAFFTQQPDRLRRFQQEARAASALNHPNILTIHEVSDLDSAHYIATEFVDGESLRDHINSTPIKMTEALDIAMQVASALSAAHQAGIIHRDIKPENIMLRRDGIVKVVDFGLAKLTPQTIRESEASTMVNTDDGIVMGTAQYMSPEQARGLKVDARTDIWSLGCVLYEMLAGRSPFDASTAGDVIVSILEREPPPLTRFTPEIPSELDWVVKKALRKERDERYQTGKEMLSDLRSLRHRLDFEAEIERNGSPDVRVTGPTAQPSDAQTANQTIMESVAHPTSSAEYLVSEIKRHTRVASFILIALVAAIGAATYFYFSSLGSATIRSMAVLPFTNDGADPDTEYLSDGITESLTNSLSQLPDMRMIARTSAERYKGRDTDPQTVARELGVEAILTGRIVRRGDQLAVSVELLDGRDSRHIWGEQYNRRPSDILAVQQEIARAVSDKLRARMTGDEQRRVTRNYTDNVQAYQLYMRGRYHWSKRTAESLRKGIEYFQQAIDVDPTYALAYSGLADCYSLQQRTRITASSEGRARARAAALRALEIDDSLAEAHASLGLSYQHAWQWAEAEREYKRAIELNPNYANAHHWHGLWLDYMGRFNEAMAAHRRAQELDPLSQAISGNLVVYHLRSGDFEAALSEARKNKELNINLGGEHWILAFVRLKQGRHEEAIAEMQKAVESDGGLPNLGHVYGVAGRRTEALAIVKQFEERYARKETNGAAIAFVYAGLGDKDHAFAWLEKDFQERTTGLPNAMIFQPFLLDPLRGDPRYADLLRRMGLPH